MKFIYWSILVLWCFITPAKAELQIDVNGAMRDPMPIAFPEMAHDGFWIGQQGSKIREVVIADLERSGLFTLIPEKSYTLNIITLKVFFVNIHARKNSLFLLKTSHFFDFNHLFI